MKRKRDFPRISIQIAGHEWTAIFAPTRWINKKYGKRTIAITECDDKEIFFRAKQCSFETVVHELFHAHVWETGARSMDLEVEQMEELCAEQFSKHAKKILALAEVILAHHPDNR